jgi:hypothetical protein
MNLNSIFFLFSILNVLLKGFEPTTNLKKYNNSPLTSESHNGENGSISDGLSDHNLSITGKLSKHPGVLVPHQVQLTRQGWGEEEGHYYERECLGLPNRRVEMSVMARLRRYTLVAVLMYSLLTMTIQVVILPQTPTTRKMV